MSDDPCLLGYHTVFYISENGQHELLCSALCDVLQQVKTGSTFYVVYRQHYNTSNDDNKTEVQQDSDEGGSSPKKRKLNDEEFHEELRF